MRELVTANKQGVRPSVHAKHGLAVSITGQPSAAARRKDLWENPPASLDICPDELHIWKIDLSLDSTEVDSVLSEDELQRAARFHFEKDRTHFKVARAALRTILGRYLGLTPVSLRFRQTEYGKPFLLNPEATGLLFNLSHSKGVALVSVTRGREVGIDVEFMRTDFATSEVAEHFFSVAEVYTLFGLSPRERTHAFFNCWTRKEAYVKARGEGLSMPLDQFDVSLAPDAPADLLGNRIDQSEMSRWILRDVPVVAGYVGAVCVEAAREGLRSSRFQFSS